MNSTPGQAFVPDAALDGAVVKGMTGVAQKQAVDLALPVFINGRIDVTVCYE
ncbi:MAG: hypothetical protein IPL27_26755 [Lewinellaceae bacterium]|nr:hypothetical protein [Lewinellaceae bacterium]